MVILGFLTIPWLGPKDTEPHAIGPKDEARTHGPRALSVPKAKLGYSNRVCHRVILPLVMAILGFLTIPWLGPKDTEPRVPSVPKAKLGHTDRVRHRVLIFTKLNTWLGFNYHPWLGPKDTEPRALSAP